MENRYCQIGTGETKLVLSLNLLPTQIGVYSNMEFQVVKRRRIRKDVWSYLLGK